MSTSGSRSVAAGPSTAAATARADLARRGRVHHGLRQAEREPVTTIAWRLAHLISLFGPPDAPHFTHPPSDHSAFTCSGTAEGALRQLDEGHDAWVSDVRSLGAAGLVRPQGSISPPEFADAPIAKLILYINMEVIHHGAEIALLRDLYLWKNSPDAL
jgi:hypothetical protein